MGCAGALGNTLETRQPTAPATRLTQEHRRAAKGEALTAGPELPRRPPTVCRIIQQADDLQRSIDYLETRNDIDATRLAYLGISWGADLGPIMTAIDKRFKVAVFAAGGCVNSPVLPEADPMNFAPHVKIPVLMLNGRYDFWIPLETCQEPFFRALGTQDKKHILHDSGHMPALLPYMKDTLNWLDHYLGPVK